MGWQSICIAYSQLQPRLRSSPQHTDGKMKSPNNRHRPVAGSCMQCANAPQGCLTSRPTPERRCEHHQRRSVS